MRALLVAMTLAATLVFDLYVDVKRKTIHISDRVTAVIIMYFFQCLGAIVIFQLNRTGLMAYDTGWLLLSVTASPTS